MAKPTSVFDMNAFPATHSQHYRWRPIFVEPVVGSGERLACGIVIASPSVERPIVIRFLTDERLSCLFGDYSASIGRLIEIAMEWARDTANDNGSEGLSPLVTGVSMGPERVLFANKDADAIAVALSSTTKMTADSVRDKTSRKGSDLTAWAAT